MLEVQNSECVPQKVESIKKPLFQIYVGCLPYKISPKVVNSYFAKFGNVERVFIPSNSKKKTLGFCIVKCLDRESMEHLLSQSHVLEGRTLVVEEKVSSEKLRQKQSSLALRRLRLQNIPRDWDNQKLMDSIKEFGAIERATINKPVVIDKELVTSAWVTFKETDSASLCLNNRRLESLGISISSKKALKKLPASATKEVHLSTPARKNDQFKAGAMLLESQSSNKLSGIMLLSKDINQNHHSMNIVYRFRLAY